MTQELKPHPRPQTIRWSWATTLISLFCFLPALRAPAADSGPLIDLDPTTLNPGPLTAWTNAGTLGGTFTAPAAAPAVTDLTGRRAVAFTEGQFLTSSFPSPDALLGGKPFTLAVWARVPTASKRDVLVSWAARPRDTAEFSYGAGPDGAFFGWDKAARFARVPAAGQWHHIAYTYASDHLRLYVDGLLDSEREFKLAPKPGGHVIVGAGWNAVDQKPAFPLHGAIGRVQIWDRALTQRELRNAAGWNDPFNIRPADGATIPMEEAALHWEAGSEQAKSFALRVTTDQAGDTTAASDVHLDKPEFQPTGLTPGRTYFWRVDQLDSNGTLLAKGPVWRFTINNGPATQPHPRDRVAGVAIASSALEWTPGRHAVAQNVYFGPDKDAVANGSATLAKALPANTHQCPLPANALEYGKTYYWRVAEDNGAIPAAPGELWAFRTEDRPNPQEVTFFVSSDCHYGLGNNADLNRAAIDRMNWLPGTPLPKQVGGGVVGTPRGVILNGDLLDKGFEPKTAIPAWEEFTRDYGLVGNDGRLAFPVYEGFGNHDGMTGKSISREGIKQRNPKRKGLTSISSNGFHYSWDWDQVHLAQLNLFPGKDSADCIVGPPNHHPENALGFLKEDLAKNVGNSGRLVIVFCHYCYTGGMADWWTDPAKDRFFDALKGYRVLLIHGHSHGAYFYTWKGVQAISDGAMARPEGQTGDFMVVRITKDAVIAAHRKPDEWGITLKVPLPPVIPMTAEPAR